MEKLTTEQFKEKIFDYDKSQEFKYEGTKPAIIDFFAEWCAPCKIVGPILEELSGEKTDIDFYEINIEEEPVLSGVFGIRSIPAVLFIPAGEEPEMVVGAQSKAQYIRLIEELLK